MQDVQVGGAYVWGHWAPWYLFKYVCVNVRVYKRVRVRVQVRVCVRLCVCVRTDRSDVAPGFPYTHTVVKDKSKWKKEIRNLLW